MARNKRQAAEQALKLASNFRNASKRVGDYLYDNWVDIPAGERVTLQGLEITLLNLATDLVSQAVDSLVSGSQDAVAELEGVTRMAHDAISRINNYKKVIRVTTALIGLAASIPTGNWGGAIKPAIELLAERVRAAIAES